MTNQISISTLARAAAVAAVLAVQVSGVLAQSGSGAHSAAGHGSSAAKPAGTSPMGDQMKSMMKADADKMAAMQPTGNPDVDFAMMMRMHHMGALRMAEMELKNGKDPQMQQMARKIIADQTKEIAQFEQFLARQGHPVEKMKP